MKNLILIIALAIFASCTKETTIMEETAKRQEVVISFLRDIETVKVQLEDLIGYSGPVHDYEMNTYVTIYGEEGNVVAEISHWDVQKDIKTSLAPGTYTVKASTHSKDHSEPLPEISDCLHFKGDTSFEVKDEPLATYVLMKHDYAVVVISDLKLAGRNPEVQPTGIPFYMDYVRGEAKKGRTYEYLTGRSVETFDTEELFDVLETGKEYRIWSSPKLNEVKDLKIFVL